MISEFWNSPEVLFYSCFYDGVELISVMTIYCSFLYWIIAYCLLLRLTLDPHLLFKCCSCFLFSVSTSQKWFFIASNCQGYISYSKHQGILPNFVREIRELSGDFFSVLGWEPCILCKRSLKLNWECMAIPPVVSLSGTFWCIVVCTPPLFCWGMSLFKEALLGKRGSCSFYMKK